MSRHLRLSLHAPTTLCVAGPSLPRGTGEGRGEGAGRHFSLVPAGLVSLAFRFTLAVGVLLGALSLGGLASP